MPYVLKPPKAGRWSHYRVRGTENGIYVDRSTKTGDRKIAQRILNEWKTEAQKQAIRGGEKSSTFAAAALVLLVLAINLVGDGLRDVTAPENRG